MCVCVCKKFATPGIACKPEAAVQEVYYYLIISSKSLYKPRRKKMMDGVFELKCK